MACRGPQYQRPLLFTEKRNPFNESQKGTWWPGRHLFLEEHLWAVIPAGGARVMERGKHNFQIAWFALTGLFARSDFEKQHFSPLPSLTMKLLAHQM